MQPILSRFKNFSPILRSTFTTHPTMVKTWAKIQSCESAQGSSWHVSTSSRPWPYEKSTCKTQQVFSSSCVLIMLHVGRDSYAKALQTSKLDLSSLLFSFTRYIKLVHSRVELQDVTRHMRDQLKSTQNGFAVCQRTLKKKIIRTLKFTTWSTYYHDLPVIYWGFTQAASCPTLWNHLARPDLWHGMKLREQILPEVFALHFKYQESSLPSHLAEATSIFWTIYTSSLHVR